MDRYDHRAVDAKWQDFWERTGAFRAVEDQTKPKAYFLIEFPYPSGEGLHVGHPRSNTALDILARKRRMQGYNVLFPIGWDAFGLPTENYAIRNGIHPRIVTERNIARFRRQLKSIGFSFDYSREVDTTDPSYYKWTQWIFLKLFEKGLAYKASIPVNWCLSCNVGLANEEVVGGHCERCGGEVVRREKSQWMLRITEYAEKLLDGLDTVDYLERIKAQQRNWIGRSEGALIRFPVDCGEERDVIEVYTTRPETIYGATYLVIAPEHPFVERVASGLPNADAIEMYRGQASRRSDFERTESPADAQKTGLALEGVFATNPVNGARIPVWIGDYVLATYGTGAVMAVPAHDERDFLFANTHQLPIHEVIVPPAGETLPYTGETGIMTHSGRFDGMGLDEGRSAILQTLEAAGSGRAEVRYRLRDWVFSRQRYWGEPIPLVDCPVCGWVPVHESDLPVKLPDIEFYQTSPDGESPLSRMREWVETVCPRCGGPARRETDTMPQWAGSSWYFLRYTDPHNETCLADPEKLAYWLPVDWYNGGMEHTTLHLLYSRFWHRFLYDSGIVPTAEPYVKRTSHGMILAEDGGKMSKSRPGSVINPDDVVRKYGADAFRIYEMFIGAFDQAIPWSTSGLAGCRRFLERVWALQQRILPREDVRPAMRHTTYAMIDKVSGDYERMKFNTAIAAMMGYVNEVSRTEGITKGEMRILLSLLHPVAPHITEELRVAAHLDTRPFHHQPWPQAEARYLVPDSVEVAVQVNGRIVVRVYFPAGLASDEAGRRALAIPEVGSAVADRPIRRIVWVPDRLVNIVV